MDSVLVVAMGLANNDKARTKLEHGLGKWFKNNHVIFLAPHIVWFESSTTNAKLIYGQLIEAVPEVRPCLVAPVIPQHVADDFGVGDALNSSTGHNVNPST